MEEEQDVSDTVRIKISADSLVRYDEIVEVPISEWNRINDVMEGKVTLGGREENKLFKNFAERWLRFDNPEIDDELRNIEVMLQKEKP